MCLKKVSKLWSLKEPSKKGPYALKIRGPVNSVTSWLVLIIIKEKSLFLLWKYISV